MQDKVAVIVIDTGFTQEALDAAGPVVGVYSLFDQRKVEGRPFLDPETLSSFAGDPLKHGSIVLSRLRELLPEVPVVLIRSHDPEVRLIQTVWFGGRVSAPGWTEAYLWAVELLKRRGLASVANCSFGRFTHAMDGSGWESYQLGRVTGPGKGGHIVLAGAGVGDGRATHASWETGTGQYSEVFVDQRDDTSYNLWVGSGCERDDWHLEIWHEHHCLARFAGSDVPLNFWNNRQQLTFTNPGSGLFRIVLYRSDLGAAATRFDCWVADGGSAFFANHVDSTLISEPAVFPHVISVGLTAGIYSPEQNEPDGKPDCLLSGQGPISFRLPELVAAVVNLLEADSGLDVDQVRKELGKHPLPGS